MTTESEKGATALMEEAGRSALETEGHTLPKHRLSRGSSDAATFLLEGCR